MSLRPDPLNVDARKPMGTYCAAHGADMLLFRNERDFVLSLTDSYQARY